jgi:hypothetical protein
MPVLLLDDGDGDKDGDVLVFASDGCVAIVDEGSGDGVKDDVQIYSSLLLISSNNISLSASCLYPLPIKRIHVYIKFINF